MADQHQPITSSRTPTSPTGAKSSPKAAPKYVPPGKKWALLASSPRQEKPTTAQYTSPAPETPKTEKTKLNSVKAPPKGEFSEFAKVDQEALGQLRPSVYSRHVHWPSLVATQPTLIATACCTLLEYVRQALAGAELSEEDSSWALEACPAIESPHLWQVSLRLSVGTYLLLLSMHPAVTAEQLEAARARLAAELNFEPQADGPESPPPQSWRSSPCSSSSSLSSSPRSPYRASQSSGRQHGGVPTPVRKGGFAPNPLAPATPPAHKLRCHAAVSGESCGFYVDAELVVLEAWMCLDWAKRCMFTCMSRGPNVNSREFLVLPRPGHNLSESGLHHLDNGRLCSSLEFWRFALDLSDHLATTVTAPTPSSATAATNAPVSAVEIVSVNFGLWEKAASLNPLAKTCHGHAHIHCAPGVLQSPALFSEEELTLLRHNTGGRPDYSAEDRAALGRSWGEAGRSVIRKRIAEAELKTQVDSILQKLTDCPPELRHLLSPLFNPSTVPTSPPTTQLSSSM